MLLAARQSHIYISMYANIYVCIQTHQLTFIFSHCGLASPPTYSAHIDDERPIINRLNLPLYTHTHPQQHSTSIHQHRIWVDTTRATVLAGTQTWPPHHIYARISLFWERCGLTYAGAYTYTHLHNYTHAYHRVRVCMCVCVDNDHSLAVMLVLVLPYYSHQYNQPRSPKCVLSSSPHHYPWCGVIVVVQLI